MGTSNKSTTTSSSAPWAPSQPYLKDNMKAVSELPASQVFDKSLAVPFSQQSMQGLQGMENFANSQAGNMADIFGNVAGEAQGKFGDAFNDVLSRTQSDMADQVNLAMSSAGRYGSGAHTGALADSIGGMTSQAMLNQINSARGQLPGMFDMALAPGQTMLDIGGLYESNSANQLQDEANRFYEKQNLPFEDLARRNAIYTGAGQLGGTSRTTATTPGTNYLGYATQAAGAGLGGK